MLVCILENNLLMQKRLKILISGWDQVREVVCVSSNEEFRNLNVIADVDFFLANLKLEDGIVT
jgi:hypothetical protein